MRPHCRSVHRRTPIDTTYTEITLNLPSYYKGENVRVITLHAGGTDIELAAPARLLEIIRYSLARTAPGAP